MVFGAGVLAVLGCYGWLVEPRRLVVTSADLYPSGWPIALDRLRVAVIGDLHAGAPAVDLDRVVAIVDRIEQLRPELVLLLGDHLADVRGGERLDIAEVATALGALRRFAPVVGVLGNHDWYAGGTRVRAALEAAGLTVLEEQAVAVSLRASTLWVAGVGDLWERAPSVAAALHDVPDGAATLLLTHNPDVIVDVPPRVALTVAGHTHGGQVAVGGRPFYPVSPRSGNRWLRGAFDVAGRLLFVTSGIGTSLWPLRLGVPPEIALLSVRAHRGRPATSCTLGV